MIQQLAVPARAVGRFFEMSMDAARAAFGSRSVPQFWTRPGWWPRVSLVPTLLVSIHGPGGVHHNILLREVGPPTCPGAGTAFGTMLARPGVTVLVAGTGATASAPTWALTPSREKPSACGCWASTQFNSSWSPGCCGPHWFRAAAQRQCAPLACRRLRVLGLSSRASTRVGYQQSDRAHRTARGDTGGIKALFGVMAGWSVYRES